MPIVRGAPDEKFRYCDQELAAGDDAIRTDLLANIRQPAE